MIAYIVRRVLYAIPILLGVNLFTFALFFFVNTPDDMARVYLGEKRITEDQIAQWKRERGYHLPYFYNDGWTEVSVRQVVEEEVKFIQGALRPGEYRLTVTSSGEGGGLTVSITPDSLTATSFSERWQPELSQEAQSLDFSVSSVSPERDSTFHSLEVTLTPSEGTPKVVTRLARKEALSGAGSLTETIFWKRSIQFLFFQFGKADDGRNIGDEIVRRIGPSLSITIPIFAVGLLTYIFFAMVVAFYRGTYLDGWGVIISVFLMSVSILFYVIGAQWMLGKLLRLAPVSGYDTGAYALKFIALPIVIGIIGGIGQGVRWYRTIFLEEIGQDYVRTARAKGLPESMVLFKHTLKNAMIPILTGVVVSIPLLFIGSLVLESFFAIPGMGSFMLEAIQRQDFAIVQAMVILGAFMYVIGLILTDISYTLVDPRIKFS
jgi:peptide/nickel transport system permease protein